MRRCLLLPVVLFAWVGCGQTTTVDPPVTPDCEDPEAPPECDPPDAGPPPQNILLIIADDLGVDRVGVYATNDYADEPEIAAGYGDRTPSIDALAANGVRFTSAWAMPVCSPTRATVYT